MMKWNWWHKSSNLEKAYALSSFLLLSYLLVRFMDMSQLLFTFPIDQYANDLSSHIAKLAFLKEFGYQATVPYWYNGTYQILTYYPPLWYLLTLPLVYLVKDPKIAAYVSLILLYILGYFACKQLAKTQRWNNIQTHAGYLFFFANPIAIGYMIRLSKLPETTGWIIGLLVIAFIYQYKEKKIEYRAGIICSFLLTLLFYAHFLVFIPLCFLVLGLFLIKSTKERILLLGSGLITVLATTPLWIPFLKTLQTSPIDTFIPLEWILFRKPITTDAILASIIPLFFWACLSANRYHKKWTKREVLFYSPSIVLSILYATRILVFIPILNRVHPDTYNFLFILLAIILFIQITWKPTWQKGISYGLVAIVSGGIIISAIQTPYLEPPREHAKELFSLLQTVEERYLILSNYPDANTNSAYAYAAAYLKKSTAGGWEAIGVKTELTNAIKEAIAGTKTRDCAKIEENIRALQVKEIIVKKEDCTFIKTCSTEQKEERNYYCLFKIV